jgi:hypothetical protein
VCAGGSRRLALPTASRQHPWPPLDFPESRHRAHARVEDRVRCGKATGLDHLPSASPQINEAWFLAATIAVDLLCWLRLLCLDASLADAEPKTLRYRLLHTAARVVRGQRKRKIQFRRPGPGPTNSPPRSTPRLP